MVGLSDEAGAGANLGLAAKMRQAPTTLEVARVDDYIQETLWGIKRNLPYNVSLQDHASGGIRASLFWVPTPVSHALHASCIIRLMATVSDPKGIPTSAELPVIYAWDTCLSAVWHAAHDNPMRQ